MVAIWMSQPAAARRRREGLRKRNARTRLVVSHKILGFLEPLSSRPLRGQADGDISLGGNNPVFMTQRL